MKAKKIMGCTLAAVVSLCNVMGVSAATLKDIFDADYYASEYSDVKEEYGDDAEALWNHFVTYGLAEGRGMNSLLDVAAYRETNADLAEAFGDDWDSYVTHFLTIGAWEGRDSGTDFNALDYAARYEDLQEAFGEDILALWNHYKTEGSSENREARDEKVVIAEKEAEEKAAREAEEQKESSRDRTERVDFPDGSWGINEYDGRGKLIKITRYNADGSVSGTWFHEYHDNGMIKKQRYISSNMIQEKEYNSSGRPIKMSSFELDGTLIEWREVIWGSNAQSHPEKEISYDRNDNVKWVISYNADGSYVKETYRDGKVVSVTKYDKNGNIIKE